MAGYRNKLVKTKAARQAATTYGRKTEFKSRIEIIRKQKRKEADDQINEYK